MKKRSLRWLAASSNLIKSCHLDCIKFVRSVACPPRLLLADSTARKYRDEPRPRQGLLRTKEFLMKDLYTFDATTEQALQTYQNVRRGYNAFFRELKIPYLTAEASSGEIGGDISHEYHLPSQKGEDNIVCCGSCNYVANEELAESRIARAYKHSKLMDEDVVVSQGVDSSNSKKINSKPGPLGPGEHLDAKVGSQAVECTNQWLGISQDRSTLVYAFLPHEVGTREVTGKGSGNGFRKTEINPHAIKRVFPEIDLGAEDPLELFKAEQSTGITKQKAGRTARILRVVDMRYILQHSLTDLPNLSSISIRGLDVPVEDKLAEGDDMIDLVRIETGDSCPNCEEGALKIESAVELGHTFHLGTRYSMPLAATIIADPSRKNSQQGASSPSSQSVTPSGQIPVQMGCHGIGVSRLIAAVADSLADDKGLNWPRIIAPFEAIIIPIKGMEGEAADVYDLLTGSTGHPSQGPIDAILDDRKREFGWKIKDADMIGYPIIVILGRGWKSDRECEVQCRRLIIKERISANNLKAFVDGLLQQL